MKKLILLPMLLLFCLTVNAQSFEQQAKQVAENIDSITTAGRNQLKLEIEQIDKKMENGEITAAEARAERTRLADYYAEQIEENVYTEKEKLNNLLDERVDNQIAHKNIDSIDNKNFNTNKFSIQFGDDKDKTEKRTTSQFVFAFGLNTLSGDDGTFPDNLKVWQSKFWEYGYTWNTRLAKDNNLTHIKYGLSLVYNNLKPEDNQIFAENGEQTVLIPTEIDFDRNRFRNFYLNIPLHFELDFSPTEINEDGNKIFRSHKGFRVGLGGYAGILINSKNFFKYEEDGKKIKYSQKDDFNVNNFTYGLSGYIGYEQFSLYTKYDLQPLFENNPTDDRNFSIGLRWDFN